MGPDDARRPAPCDAATSRHGAATGHASAFSARKCDCRMEFEIAADRQCAKRAQQERIVSKRKDSTHRRPDARLAPEEDGLIKFMVDDRNVEVHASGSGRSVKTAGIALWGDTTYSDDSGTTEVSLRPVSSRRRRWPPGCGYREGVVPFHDGWSRARGYERVRSISFVAHQDGGAVQGRPSLRLAPTVSEREARPRFARSAQLENIVELSRRPIRPVTRRTT